MALKHWIARAVPVLGLIVAGMGLYLANVRQLDDLRVAISGYPAKMKADRPPRNIEAEFDQLMTFINSGTRSATITKIALFINQPDEQDASECGHWILSPQYGSDVEPFEIKPNETKAVPSKGTISAPISEANKGKQRFNAEICAAFRLVVPDSGSMTVRKLLDRDEISVGAVRLFLGEPQRDPITLFYRKKGFLDLLSPF